MPCLAPRNVFPQVDGTEDEWEISGESTTDSRFSTMKRIRLRVRKAPRRTVSWLKKVPKKLKNSGKGKQPDPPKPIMIPLCDMRDEDGNLRKKEFGLKVLDEVILAEGP